MAEDMNERLSEHRLRMKPRDQKLHEASEFIANLFDEDAQLEITESAKGDRRVRAYIPDEDASVGYIEDSSYIGLAEVAGSEPPKYVAERHYPNAHRAGKPTFTWEFTPENDELLMQYIKTARADEPVLDLPAVADESGAEDFWQAAHELRIALPYEDYEKRRSEDIYDFTLPELQ